MRAEDRVHEGIRTLHPYVPGRPIEEVARQFGLSRVIKLASNENPLGPSPRAVERVVAATAQMHRYPDGASVDLKAALAARHGLEPGQLCIGNGSNELLELALRTFVRPGETVVSADVTFSVYGILAQALGARYMTVPVRDMAYDLEALADLAARQRARLVFVANPNNPTGTAFGAAALRAFLRAVPTETLVVYDAAYAEYGAAAGIPDGLAEIAAHDNLLVTRTFSKAHGLAGLRVGWGAAQAGLIDMLERVRQPFNVSRLAQEAALGALGDDAWVSRVVELNRESLAVLGAGLAELGLRSWPSHANFVLLESPLPADDLFQQLMRRGVIVRSMRGFGLPAHVRVNTGTAEENRLFLEALADVLAARGR